MVVAAFFFSVMAACVKWAGRHYGIAEIVLYRSLIGAAILYTFVLWRGSAMSAGPPQAHRVPPRGAGAQRPGANAYSLATPLAGLHLRRGISGTVALALWFYATTILPLGTAMTLNYASSLYLAAIVIGISLRQRKRVDMKLAAAVIVGFIGVLLVLQPSFSRDQWIVALAGLFSGILAAVAYWNVRELGQLGEPEWRTVFYFSLMGTLLGLAGSLVSGFSTHTSEGALLLVGVGVSALLAQLAMTRAFGSVHTLLVANLQYSAIVFASILGVALFGDRIPLIGWISIAVIIVSGVAASTFTARRRITGPAEVIDVEPAAEK